MKTIVAADLFAGAGGSSTALRRACERLGRKLKLTAVNHNQTAIETHTINHPAATHFCEKVEDVNPRSAVPGGKLDILVAGVECTYFSNARGGKPCSDQSRASAWCVLRWLSALRVERVLIENVREFLSWGPLDKNGRPLKSKKGETFAAFVEAIRSLGYKVDWRLLNAADYGDPQSRERLFVQCRLGRKPISWPEPTHSRTGEPTLFGVRQPWRPARDIIDWSIRGTSIFGRKRPLEPSTIARIAAGLKKFGGAMAEPFLVLLNGGGCKGQGGARSLDRPLPTIAAGGEHFGLVDPFILSMEHGKSVPQFIVPTNHGETKGGKVRVYPLDQPIPTITTVDAWAVIEPFLTRYNNNRPEVCARSLTDPLPTIDCNDRYGLVVPGFDGLRFDILFRMLQPHELAAGQSFPRSYIFAGNRRQKVKQIGNAWPGELGEKLMYTMIQAA